jgi:hypothetical protein
MYVPPLESEAHETVEKPTEVTFTTKSGKEADFGAQKNVKVPVHAKFTVNTKKKQVAEGRNVL